MTAPFYPHRPPEERLTAERALVDALTEADPILGSLVGMEFAEARAERRVLAAVRAWRDAELNGIDVGSPEWRDLLDAIRTQADRLPVPYLPEPVAAPALVANRADEVERRAES